MNLFSSKWDLHISPSRLNRLIYLFFEKPHMATDVGIWKTHLVSFIFNFTSFLEYLLSSIFFLLCHYDLLRRVWECLCFDEICFSFFYYFCFKVMGSLCIPINISLTVLLFLFNVFSFRLPLRPFLSSPILFIFILASWGHNLLLSITLQQ